MAERLHAWGWDDHWEAALADFVPLGGRPARVTSRHRDRWTVEAAGGTVAARVVAELDGPPPATGDWVLVEPGAYPSDPWAVRGVLPRRSAVCRGSAGDGRFEQVLAANVDRLWIVQALDTPPNLRRLERSLAIGWESGAAPEIVLTKSDLAPDPAQAVALTESVALGVPIWVVSVSHADALDALAGSLAPGSTVALLGPSGAGKSTLINHLAGSEVAETGAVRAGDRKGRHTTTRRELIRIRGGALLLDTPGLREMRVLALDEGLGRTFPEIDALAETCRFRDCAHETEPGCAVLGAVADGSLPEERLGSFRKLLAEAAYENRKNDPRAAAAALAEMKTAMKTLKYHDKHRQDR